jgi:hypothetical protein
MKNENKPLYSYDYEQQEQKYDLRVARLFGFALGVVASAVFIFILIF